MKLEPAQKEFDKLTTFSAKVLLFGEYTVLDGSDALSVPYTHYSGCLSLNAYHAKEKQSNQLLFQFFKYLLVLRLSFLNYQQLEKDLVNGLHFSSDIPMQSGLGSSGALVAAIYANYVSDIHEDFIVLKNRLSKMEEYFHSKSSGIDPLVSYCKLPVFLNSGALTFPDINRHKNIHAFLISSKQPGSTHAAVQGFIKSEGYKKIFETEYLDIVNSCIRLYLNDDPSFFTSIASLTSMQQKYFVDLFPQIILSFLQKGMASELFYLKLCGSGSGGYYLGFTKYKEICKTLFFASGYESLWLDF